MRENRSGPRGLVPLCHCVTSPEGERKRLPPFQSLALFFGDRGLIPGLFFYARETSFGQSLRASRLRTPLSLRDISRGRTETSAAVSVARTVFKRSRNNPRPLFAPAGGVVSEKLSGRTWHYTDKLCGLLNLSGLKRFLAHKLLVVAVMSVNNRFNKDKITHKNFSREHPCEVSFLCARVR